MIQNDDWRLLNDVDSLKKITIIPTDGEEIVKHAPHLKKCVFCWDIVQNTPYQRWFIAENICCCICEQCYNDFKLMFNWRKLDG